MEKIINTEGYQMRASFVPKSFNKEERTFEVVFATTRPVKRWNYELGGWYNEVLDIRSSSINLERLKSGAPVLDSHYSYSLSTVIGVVESVRIDEEKEKAIATIRLSKRKAVDDIANDVEDGILRNISVGYTVQELREEDKDKKIYRATKWTPMEVSIVPIPADPKSGVRSENQKQIVETHLIHNSMETENTVREKAQQQQNVVVDAQVNVRSNNDTAAAKADQSVDVNSVRAEAIEQERKRISEIKEMCKRAGLDATFADSLIEKGTTVEDARVQVIDKIAERRVPPVNAAVTGDDEGTKVRESIISGIMHRIDADSVVIKDNEKAVEYRNMSLLELAKDRLRAKGENYRSLSAQEVVKRAWATTDYPLLLTSTVERTLRKVYDGYVEEWKHIARKETVTDFREKTGIKVDGAVTFEEIPEDGEYRETRVLQYDTAGVQVKKYGRKFSISDRAIINDDLGVFQYIPRMMAVGAQVMRSELVWDMIRKNAKAPDGKNMFHADHKNLAQTGGAIGESTLSAARIAMRRQKSPAGHLLGIRPKYLLVPPELEVTAQKMVSSIWATKDSDVNVFANSLEVMVSDALIDPKAWYLVADPKSSICDGLVYANLSGEEGLKVQSRINWDTDALEIKGSQVFGVAVWGWEGWYKNPGPSVG